jgi:flagellar biosynthesis/type III secretory pathway protein FliH
MTGSGEAHLKQRQLEGIKDIEEIQEDLREALSKAEFGGNQKGVQLCKDKGLPKASQKFRTATGLHGRVVKCN